MSAAGNLLAVPTPPAGSAASRRPQRVPGLPLEAVEALLGLPTGGDGAGVGAVLSGVTLDSRQVLPGDLYAALPGSRVHGASFSDQAAAAGAVAVLTDPAGRRAATSAGLPVLVVDDPRGRLGDVAAAVYGQPGRDIQVLGVTGTNGKTTTTYLLDAALRAAGRTTGLVGTVETRVAGVAVPSTRTTPESPDVHALLAVMREQGVTVCAMEVSSHALALHRVDGLVVDVAAFTNLSQDHLDFHLDLEDYFGVKASLFTPARSRRGVVCVDDAWGARLAAEAGVPVVTVATRGADADWRASDVEVARAGQTTTFILTARDGTATRLRSPLPGDFNVANTALAFVVLLEAGCAPDVAARGLAAADGVPGRMETVRSAPGDRQVDEPLAVVDYAHSPDAVAAALRALRPSTAGRLVVVLGAGGDRDAGKRPAMGRAAALHADLVVVTDDNPRSEDPAAVRAAVLAGAREGTAEVVEVPGRRAAILAAVAATSGSDDTVLVAGRGHEAGQEVAGTVHPFDDRVVLLEALTQDAAGARR